jgi:hypothetical protein
MAEALAGIDDDEVATLSCQVIADGEPGLAGADYHGVEPLALMSYSFPVEGRAPGDARETAPVERVELTRDAPPQVQAPRN